MIWEFILKKLEKDIKVVLLTVVESKGSSPGKAGFKLALSEDDEWEGSVGGGIMEFELMEEARDLFQSEHKVRLKRLVHGGDKGPDSSGMICAGSQKVVLLLLKKEDLTLIRRIVQHASGKMTISAGGLHFVPGGREVLSTKKTFNKGEPWSYEENLGTRPHLYIFGGGHVGLAVSRCFSLLDFDITLFDNRSEELKTIRSNHYLEDIQIIDYTEAEDVVPEGPENYVVIMTSSHESDGLILEQMLSKKLSYLGMMGSAKKAKFIMNTLKKTGLSEEELGRVDTPIGLDIESETPMEIAISIAAKIIQVKNTSMGGI